MLSDLTPEREAEIRLRIAHLKDSAPIIAPDNLLAGDFRNLMAELDRLRAERDTAEAAAWTEGRRFTLKRMCWAFDQWADLCQKSLESDHAGKIAWRKEFSVHWNFIRLALTKSCLLDRLIYGLEKVRTIPCPDHKGKWSGCFGKCEYGCFHGGCVTGWLPEPETDEPRTLASHPNALELGVDLSAAHHSGERQT